MNGEIFVDDFLDMLTNDVMPQWIDDDKKETSIKEEYKFMTPEEIAALFTTESSNKAMTKDEIDGLLNAVDQTQKYYESEDKAVSHPVHYQSKAGLEVIDVIDAFTEGLTGIEAVDTGNIIKYICRWNKKGNPIQNIEKAIWYSTHLLNHLRKKEGDSTNV